MTNHASSSGHDALNKNLTQLRDAIDGIDNEILHLLAKLQNLSRDIVKQKVLGSNVFRPDREVSLLRALVAKHDKIDPALIMGLWRHIISASIAEQKPDYTIAHSAEATRLAYDHSAGYMRCQSYEQAADAIKALIGKQADCVIITDDEVDLIAPLLGAPADNEVLDNAVYISASISFLVQKQAPRGYILCRDLPGPSGDDYVVIRDADGHLSHHKATDELPDGTIVGQYPAVLSFEG